MSESTDDPLVEEKVNFNVRGVIFSEPKSLFSKYPDTFLNALVNGKLMESTFNESVAITLDRDPLVFETIINFYKYGWDSIRNCNFKVVGKALAEDADFYCLQQISERIDTCKLCGDLFYFGTRYKCKGKIEDHQSDKYSIFESDRVLSELSVTEAQVLLLQNWIQDTLTQALKFKISKLSLGVLYDSSVHGFSDASFHKQVDINAPMLAIFKSCNGYLFGGFSCALGAKCFAGIFPEICPTFIFTLTNPYNIPATMFLPKNGISAGLIFKGFYQKYGPTFGVTGNGIELPSICLRSFSNCNGGVSHFGLDNGSYIDTTGLKGSLFTGGKLDFNLNDGFAIELIERILIFRVSFDKTLESKKSLC